VIDRFIIASWCVFVLTIRSLKLSEASEVPGWLGG